MVADPSSPIGMFDEQGPASNPLLVVLLGATASGKSALAVELGEKFGGEIISCDSVAVYRELQIGTAKPSIDDRARVPHHMLDIVNPDQPYTAGDYARDGRTCLSDVASRGSLPIISGGTGLYLRALLLGLFAGPQRSEPLRERLRQRAIQRGDHYLWRLLNRLDPATATIVHPNDAPKIVRAIEVCITARVPISRAWQAGRDPLRGFRILRIGLNPLRADLYARINRRAAAMFEQGLVEETKDLLDRYGAECRPLGSLGYYQAQRLLQGRLSLQEAVAATQQGHRNYAKRQATWFRREPDVHWIPGFGDNAATVAQVESLIQATLQG